MKAITFEEYLRENNAKGIIDLSLRIKRCAAGEPVDFYIHPARAAGDTPDYKVAGNELTQQNVEHAPVAPPPQVTEPQA